MGQITFIDLFSGIGGFRIALEKCGAKCVLSSEIDKWAIDTYYNNFNEYPMGDISKIEADDIPNHDILCAGFPCQPFSIGGLRKGFLDTRGTLFFEVARILKEKKPKAFILENVKGLINHEKGETLKVILDTLDEVGYNFSYKIMNAKNYNVPQNRERWYCVGFRKDINVNFSENDLKGFRFPKEVPLKSTVDMFINKDISGYKITEIAKNNINKHIHKYIEKNGEPTGYIIANEIRPSRCSFKSDGIVPCFTAKMGTGGNNVPVVVQLDRKLTERECLDLMGFPKEFKIRPNYHQSYKQIGNSVVVPIIEMLAKEVIRIIDNENI